MKFLPATTATILLGSLSVVGSQGMLGGLRAAPVEVLHVRGPIYMLAGAGGNVTVSVGPDGVLTVDSGSPEATDEVLTAIRGLQQQLSLNPPPRPGGAGTRSTLEFERRTPPPPKPIRYVINTHIHMDHMGGNEAIVQAGQTLTGGNVTAVIDDAAQGAAVYAHENVLFQVTETLDGPSPVPFDAWPTSTFRSEYFKLSQYFNGEGIQLLHQPRAHTDGDVMVWFRGSDVISTGDVFVTTSYPVIDREAGGTVQGIIDGLNRVLEVAFPEFRTEGGTMIIPGHGRLSDSADVGYYRDMVVIIRDRVQSLIDMGMSLAEVQVARPTAGYDSRYGATSGLWTTEMFVEAVYRSLRGEE
jgi:cyclase